MTRGATDLVRKGWAAIAAGVLLMLSIGLELAFRVQEGDGTVVEPARFVALVVMWAVAFLAIAATVTTSLPRRRVGARLVVAGSGIQVLFAAVVVVSGLTIGKPWEPAFLLYALGFLALIVGGTLLGFAVRRERALRPAAVTLWIGAAAAAAAIAVSDPWHDIALFVFDGTWIMLGLTLLRRQAALTMATRSRGNAAAEHPAG